MTALPPNMLHQLDAAETPDLLARLIALAEMIEVDAASQTLIIRNGKSRLMLRKDGTIRVEGTSIVQTATRNIALDAAWIDLN